jgi:glucose-6-phosphate 1-epimerase
MNASSVIADLDERFGIPRVARVVAGNDGLAKVVVSSQYAQTEMYLHGAHVTSWVPRGGSEVFYISPHSLWQDGRAIRGGVPICFPWFGDKADDPSAPAHGLVRTKAWELESITVSNIGVSVSMATESNEATRKWWPHDFRLVCVAIFGTQLTLKLIVSNTGATPFTFEEALHAYFSVGDAETAVVQGLDGTDYLDKTDHRTRKTHHGDLTFSAETDSVFLNTQHVVELSDPAMHRRIILQKQNSLTTVVWSPWAEKSSEMSDLGDGQWRNFVCLETSNVGEYAVPLAPGQQHVMSVTVHASSGLHASS